MVTANIDIVEQRLASGPHIRRLSDVANKGDMLCADAQSSHLWCIWICVPTVAAKPMTHIVQSSTRISNAFPALVGVSADRRLGTRPVLVQREGEFGAPALSLLIHRKRVTIAALCSVVPTDSLLKNTWSKDRSTRHTVRHNLRWTYCQSHRISRSVADVTIADTQ